MAERLESMGESEGFEALALDKRLVTVLKGLGYEEPTPIQRAAIPVILEGRDLIGQAATGTGKTAAFALPLIQKIAARGKSRPQPSALVLAPTRELAMQVAEAVHRYGSSLGVRALPIYGGQGYEQQIRGLNRGTDIVIATPGRALDHIRRGTLSLEHVTEIVLDEADEMLDMGFIEDIESILKETAEERQVVLFSATLPTRVASVAKRYLRDPAKITIAQDRVKPGAMPRVRQTAYIVGRAQKVLALSRILDVEDPKSAIIFCRTRTEVDELTSTLNAHGRGAEALHGGMTQQQRERVIKKLRDEKVDLVVATDVAARGLDIDQLTHVVNFDVPSAPEAYVHRIGRVGRAGREGVAITLAEPREHRLLRNIEFATKQKIEVGKVPSVADLQARRLEATLLAVRDAIQGEPMEGARAVVETLADEFDVMDVALAAITLLHRAQNPKDDATVEIEDVASRPPHRDGGAKGPRGKRPPSGPMTRIRLNAGRNAGIRPQDLVGAIAGEAGIAGREIGAIDLAPAFAVVEIASDKVERVLAALSATKIKGKKISARLA